MISDETLKAAVETGVITAEQAVRLHGIEAERSGAEPEDDESLRLVGGFGDIFVTIGLALFIGAAAYFLNTFGVPAMAAGVAAIAWALAEFFTRRRRMALPSIVLLVVFAVSVFAATAFGLGSLLTDVPLSRAVSLANIDRGWMISLAIAGVATAGMTVLHFRRFKVPITIAAGVAGLIATGLAALAAAAPEFTGRWLNAIILLFGVVAFALAMRFDMSDPLRTTRRTDIAFWLHLLAAPMIVHSLISGLFDRTAAAGTETRTAAGILVMFALLGAVALLVDRRALLVSGLSYAGFAFAMLLKNSGLSGSVMPLTLLILGTLVLLLSAGWRPLRAYFLRLLPRGLASRLPHTLPTA